MKQGLLLVVFFKLMAFSSIGQLRTTSVDKSPMDMAYYPINYPVLKIQNKVTEPLLARVIYSRPQKNGRSVFGELVEYGKIWRLGANEATEIELFKDVKLSAASKLKKGRYTMYAIPFQDKWTVIFNRETDVWGAFQYDNKKDVIRVDVPVEKAGEPVEAFTMQFEKDTAGLGLVILWDNVKATIPFNFNTQSN